MKFRSIVFCFVLLAAGALSISAQEKTSLEYLEEGSRAYQAHEYKLAIPPFQKAFDLEKKERKLDKKLWFVLIDNLGIAYGITGDIKSSQDVLLFGIKKEPTYPMFYYNMACGFGELNAEEDAIDYLRRAFKFKANMIEGESFPDPTRDSSFSDLMQRKTFQKAIAEMKSGK